MSWRRQCEASLKVMEHRVCRRIVAIVLSLACCAVILPYCANAYWIRILTSAFICAIAAAGIGVLYRQLGLVCLSQYALIGVGGWISMRCYQAFALPFESCVLAGAAGGCAAGILVGVPALRLRGLYLALSTLMMAGAFQVFISAINFPDGAGLADGAQMAMNRPFVAQSDGAYLRYVLAWLIAALCLIEIHVHSVVGRSWALIRTGDRTALSNAVNIVFYQTWGFALAGLLAGLSGALLAGAFGKLDGRAFPASESVLMFALVIVAGVYDWFGAVIAGLLMRAFPALLSDFGVDADLSMMFFGVALMHALMTAPTGIAGQLTGLHSAIVRRWKNHD
jgi:branched-chain amino acid transport system permease protein